MSLNAVTDLTSRDLSLEYVIVSLRTLKLQGLGVDT